MTRSHDRIKKPDDITPTVFRVLQDLIFQVDDLTMGEMLGFRGQGERIVRRVKRLRSGKDPVSGPMAVALWFYTQYKDVRPPWVWPNNSDTKSPDS